MKNQVVEFIAQSMNTTSYIIACVLCIASVVAMWKIFTKAGEAGWKSIIPILNVFVMVKIIDGKAVKALLLLIPIVSQIYAIILQFRMAKAYGKGTGFGFGLLFLNTIFIYILAFGSARYIGPKGE